MLVFTPVCNAKPSAGLVLQPSKNSVKFLRITHVFPRWVYAMWVGEPEEARYARKPQRIAIEEIGRMANARGAAWGQLALPTGFLATTDEEVKQQWELIEPLVLAFDSEENLRSANFTLLIAGRAEEMRASISTARRTILRYYYFGRTKLALAALPPGVKPGDGGYALTNEEEDSEQPVQRRGPQPEVSVTLGKNKFVVSAEDIDDMVRVHRRSNLNGKFSTFVDSHETYLKTAFKQRNSQWHARYINRECPEPVTYRQFRYYWHIRTAESQGVAPPILDGSLSASGPGEIYEIDATGGRIFLVARVKRGDVEELVDVGKPWIYILIDRWSRYVLAIFLTLNAPSAEEAKQLLLIAFTSRERRFASLRVNVDDKRWPPGVLCSAICCDRGSDFMSDEFQRVVEDDLRIALTTLPPLRPDGKAIVERVIRELKRKMAAKGIRGAFAARPLDPVTKRAARDAQAAAVESLADALRESIEIVDKLNHRPHAALKKKRELTQAGVEPTPVAAYEWGLRNITGLRRPPFTDEDYVRMLMRDESAVLRGDELQYRDLTFKPANAAARNLASSPSKKSRKISVKVDRSDLYEILVPSRQNNWPLFRITQASARRLAGRTLDEDRALSAVATVINAYAQHEFTRASVANASEPSSRRPKKVVNQERVVPNAEDKRRLRAMESVAIKRHLHGNPPVDVGGGETVEEVRSESSWQIREKKDRKDLIAAIAASIPKKR